MIPPTDAFELGSAGTYTPGEMCDFSKLDYNARQWILPLSHGRVRVIVALARADLAGVSANYGWMP